MIRRILLPWLLLLLTTAGCHRQHLTDEEPTDALRAADLGNDIAYDNPHIPASLRKVAQYQHDTLLNIVEFDQRGRLRFKYYKQYVGKFWNGRYVTMLTANVYEGNRLVKIYDLHSNTGLSIRHYVASWLGTETTCFYQDNDYESSSLPANSNSFRFVEKLTSYQAVLTHPRVRELEKRASPRPSLRLIGDALGRVVERTYFDEQGQAARTTTYEYDDQHLTGEREYSRSDGRSTQTRYAYSPANQLQALITTDNQGDTIAHQQGRYSPRGDLLESVSFEQQEDLAEFGLGTYSRYGKLVYHYEKPQVVSQIDYYTLARYGNCQVNCAPNLLTTTLYQRNKEGFVTERRELDARTGKAKTYCYRYTYSYF